jgi:hypothetical protein
MERVGKRDDGGCMCRVRFRWSAAINGACRNGEAD